MPKLNPEQFQEKHARNLKAAAEDMVAGAARVTVAPTELAAKKIDKMKANFVKAIESGKVERGLHRVTLEQWKTKYTDIGIPRVAAGIDGAKEKVIAFASELLPFEATLQSDVAKMPDLTITDSVARASKWIVGMSKFKRTK